MHTATIPPFALGQIVATPGALDAMQAERLNVDELLNRHLYGDWGDLDDESLRANDRAIDTGEGPILSRYVLPQTKAKLWVITEADRSATTFLLPLDR